MFGKAFALAALLSATATVAQPVYESRDRAGPVFSDMPSPGAREVHLPPANVTGPGSAVAPLPAPPPPAPPPPAAVYAGLQIAQPEEGGTVHSNTGQFSVALTLASPRGLERGDAIAVRLDGTVLPDSRSTLQFDISADEWQMAARDQVEHTLEVAIVDPAGNPLLVAAPVRFYVHRAFRRN